MSSINGVGNGLPVQKTVTPIYKELPVAAGASRSASDRVEVSGVSHLLAALKANDIRSDKVAAVRAQIADGTYETDDKLDAAVDRLLDDLLK